MRIFVGNIPFDATEEDIKELFQSFGEVLSVTIRYDEMHGYSRGTGFVDMLNDAEGSEAVRRLTGYQLKGCNLRVNEARPRTERHKKKERDNLNSIIDMLQCDLWEADEQGEPAILAALSLLDVASSLKSILLQMLTNNKENKVPLRVAAGICLALFGDPRDEITTIEDMNFCFVPKGPFWFGEGQNEEIKKLDYDYWMGHYPITNAQFSLFVRDGGYSQKEFWLDAERAIVWDDGYIITHGRKDKKPVEFGQPYNLPNFPVVGVNWFEVSAFAMWLTQKWHKAATLPSDLVVSIPSEFEWEKAARGGLSILKKPQIGTIKDCGIIRTRELMMKPNPHPKRKYVWGDTFNPKYANVEGCGINCSNAIGAFPKDLSPYGCAEMCGNVLEWTRSIYETFLVPSNPPESLEANVFRGASSTDSEPWAHCSARSRDLKDYHSRHRGFRLAIRPVDFS